MRLNGSLAAPLIVTLFLVACSSAPSNNRNASTTSTQPSGDLTRPLALSLLNASSGLKIKQINFNYDKIEAAKKDGVFTAGMELTPKSAPVLSDPYIIAGIGHLKVPLQLKVAEITGISDAPLDPSTKVVEFKWQIVNPPELVTKYAPPASTDGSAFLKRYDDGWRVTRIDCGSVSCE